MTMDRSVYDASILSIVSQILLCGVMICFKMLPRSFLKDIVLMVVLIVTKNLGYSFEQVFMKVMFSKMVPSTIQCASEGIRGGVGNVAMIAGSLTVAVLLPVLHWWSSAVAAVYMLLLLGFVLRKKSLVEPREIDFQDKVTRTRRKQERH